MEKMLNANELLVNYQYLMDIMWVIYPEEDSVEILKDTIAPELVNIKQDYTSLCNFLKSYVYPVSYTHLRAHET